MSLYEIVFAGELVPGAQLQLVKNNLAKLFQADDQRIALLFSGRRLVLKNNLDAAAAEKYRATLERAGARAWVVAMAMEIEEIEMAPPPDEPGFVRRPAAKLPSKVVPRDLYMAAFVDVQAPDFAIAEVGADLQDAKPAARPPALDLSQMSLAPAGADMGQVKAAPAPQAPDTSHLKIIS
ncbi:MAG: hypothetical protein PW845_11025 [Pseudomonas sp.]|uniref:hypothetical protein n=1 Tax=Pseudomonas abieticivorans TaxID=2931382 RepID=UPI0020BFFC12|nr:hypothetical protein [Pseudomonas sp. PIA16]MDE1165898.1 hypothetical protein [Pseudomonas sp.]